jgi:DNA-binding NarL/FixJ family response regulator
MDMSSPVRVLVVDDFKPWLSAVNAVFANEVGVQIVGTAVDGPEAIARAEVLRPDLILMDISLPFMSGIEAAWQIIDLVPDIKIIFLTERTEPELVQAAFAVGGRGYVLKSSARCELLSAIKAVVEGKRYIARDLGGYDITNNMDT